MGHAGEEVGLGPADRVRLGLHNKGRDDLHQLFQQLAVLHCPLKALLIDLKAHGARIFAVIPDTGVQAGGDIGDSVPEIVVGQTVLVVHGGAELKVLVRDVEILPHLEIRAPARPLV